jgi:hypothetical protein
MEASRFQCVMSASKLSALRGRGSANTLCQMICGGGASILYFLALARAVAMKVVLRPSGNTGVAPTSTSDTSKWDFLFHQSGYVGSAVLFHNGDAKEAISSLPPQKLNDALAITICKDLPAEDCSQEQGQKMVSKIADLKLDRRLYEQQHESLHKTNPVHQAGPQLDQETLTRWCPDPKIPVVPPPVSECVVTVPVQGGVGSIVRQGPAESTEQAEAARNDADAYSSAENRYISALEPEVHDFNHESEGTQEVVVLLEQLKDLENAAARSVAVEMESATQPMRKERRSRKSCKMPSWAPPAG